MLDFLKKLVLDWPTCRKCGSTDLAPGHYNRGYNNWCRQACGDDGYFCNKCYAVTFKQTLEEYKKKLPHWCVAHSG